jgi:hypothetical protein
MAQRPGINKWSIFRVEDGSFMGSFDSSDNLFLKPSIDSHRPKFILDEKARQIYKLNLTGILHLGAFGVNLFADDIKFLRCRNDSTHRYHTFG